jgi:hypothetical protein
MKNQQNSSARASALQITLSIALLFAFTILLALAAMATPILGNYPDTSLFLSTDTTVTPDAPPTNTMRITVSTSTDFDGTLEGDPTTGLVRVTNAHPAGTYTVTVKAFDGGGATATKTFGLRVTTPTTCNHVSFAAATNYGPVDYPISVAVGDFNRDGNQDLATAYRGPFPDYNGGVSILLGDGAGNFSGPTNFSAGIYAVSVAVGDFNRDGNQDLAVVNSFSDNVSILLGDGAGHFSAPTNITVGDFPFSVAVGDFNGDGKQDLAVANGNLNSVSILLGDGAGHFSAPTNITVGDFPSSVAVGDFNGDGKQDIAVAHNSLFGFDGGVSIVLGDGTGHFSAPLNFTFGNQHSSVMVGDFNGDRKQDLALTTDGSVSILLGDGTGNFSGPTNFAAGDAPLSVAVGDFNGDAKQDLAVANFDSDNVSILLGDGAGNFSTPAPNFATGQWPQSVAVGDFDGDGKQDLAVANFLSNDVSVLLRQCPVSQITPVGATCSQFLSGTAETLNIAQYGLQNDFIHRVAPRNFLYWVAVTAPAGNNTFEITQTITTGNFDTFFATSENGSVVLDSDCLPLQRRITQSGDTVRVRFTAPAAGTYFMAIKFNSQNLIGKPQPSPGRTVHYDFTTTGVPASTSGLDLVKY